jgi:hypothetical protein
MVFRDTSGEGGIPGGDKAKYMENRSIKLGELKRAKKNAAFMRRKSSSARATVNEDDIADLLGHSTTPNEMRNP